MNQLSGAFGGLGRTATMVTRLLTVGVLGGLAAATKAAITFDRSMRNVNSIAKLSERQFQALSKQVLGLAKASGQMPDSLAKGLYDIVSSGFDATDALKILTVTSKAATAGLTDTATATKAVVAVLNAYHLSATKSGRVADILFQTVNKGVLTFEELASQIGDVLPVAAQLGVPLESIGGALATITLHGVPAAEAATQLKQLIVSLLKPSDDLRKTMKSWGFETGELALKTLGLEGFMRKLTVSSKGSATAFADWFPNVRAMNGALGITGKNVEQLTTNIKAMSEKGAAGAAFAEQGKSIAVQWQKAKAALVAAAIPIGQLLFPALKAGAEKVAEFSQSIQANMPMIRAQFSELAGATRTMAGALADVGRSREGQVAIAGIASAFVGGRATTGVVSFVKNLRQIHPALAILTGAFGVLGAAIYADVTAMEAYERATARAVQTSMLLRNALDGQAQANLTLRASTHQVEAAQYMLAGAQALAVKTAREYGAGSQQHKQALLNVKLASDQLAQSKLNLKNATKNAEKADIDAAAATRAHRKAVAEARVEAQNAGEAYVAFKSKVPKRGDLHEEVLHTYAQAIGKITKNLGGTKKEAADAAGAVIGLASALGRLPTEKEVRIFVRTFNTQTTLENQRGRLPGRSRAAGGFVPGGQGQAVPILAHAGEIILNPGQQAELGGPRFLADLFGFQGERGPSFAAGGIVGRRGLQIARAKPSPWRRLRGRAKSASGAARTALSAVEAVNQSQSNLDRMYGQLAREFDISQEQFLVDGPDGTQLVDASAVSQRLSEIDHLSASRGSMLALIDQEKAELEKAVEKLRQAIKDLQAAIRAEIRAAHADALAIRRLEGKKKRTKDDEAQLTRLRASESGHRSTAQTYGSRAQEFSQALRGASGDLANVLPFDRRDVELDLMELQAERRLVAGTTAPAFFGGGGGGDGGSISDFTGGGILGPDLSGVLAEMREEIGRLRLALGLEAVQLPIIAGSLQKGTLHVPSDALYQLHAGERVTPAGVPQSASASTTAPNFNVVLEGDLASLGDFVRVKAVEVAEAGGTRADFRRRAGGF